MYDASVGGFSGVVDGEGVGVEVVVGIVEESGGFWVEEDGVSVFDLLEGGVWHDVLWELWFGIWLRVLLVLI